MPTIAQIRQWLRDDPDSYQTYCHTASFLKESDTHICVLTGTSGSGKTATLFRLLTECYDQGIIGWYKYPKPVVDRLPEYLRERSVIIEELGDLAGIPATIVIDDAALGFQARGFSGQKAMDSQAQLTIERHQGHKVLLTIQNLSLLDKMFFQGVEVHFIHKWMNPNCICTEREEYQDLQLMANERLQDMRENIPKDQWRGLAYSSSFDEILYFPLVDWWDCKYSTPWEGYAIKKGLPIKIRG